jgi:hypothetical protein
MPFRFSKTIVSPGFKLFIICLLIWWFISARNRFSRPLNLRKCLLADFVPFCWRLLRSRWYRLTLFLIIPPPKNWLLLLTARLFIPRSIPTNVPFSETSAISFSKLMWRKTLFFLIIRSAEVYFQDLKYSLWYSETSRKYLFLPLIVNNDNSFFQERANMSCYHNEWNKDCF